MGCSDIVITTHHQSRQKQQKTVLGNNISNSCRVTVIHARHRSTPMLLGRNAKHAQGSNLPEQLK